ncbi:rod shape-determining protein RodA [Solitalea lacus]|uniref:rod shape-determining protein RodA n=1 Tax=Solitalea lacus TaxID=2911172 RepID=UPI001EDB52F4|nr:rod shape-determining protein RodA [Solitalea lacus]UKJ08678.1 rod shape-determining protein RodA [Solitalea lacus]
MNQKQQTSPFYNVDWITIIIYLCLVLIGWLNIYAAVYDADHSSIFDMSRNYGKQLIWILTSVIIITAILLIDSKFFNFSAYAFYGITLILLVAVLFVGKLVGGNRAWFEIGSFRLQPAEFAKVASSLALARFLGSNTLKLGDFSDQLKCFSLVFTPVLLILLQPDAGSAMVFMSFFLVLYREGLPPFYLVFGLISVILFVLSLLIPQSYIIITLLVIVGFLLWKDRRVRRHYTLIIGSAVLAITLVTAVNYTFNNVLKPHQRDRIDLLLGKKVDPKGIGYNVNQSKIAIGSGQLLGKGFLKGTQTKYDFVPEQSTDFIFCTVGEEWGFLGSLVVLGLYSVLLMRIIALAERQRSTFSRVYGYGVASIIFFHLFINIGMTIGIMPVIGIPLPFISYGGSSLWSFTILLFILIKLDTNRNGIIR